ncbi:MAG: excisionase family DNA-binding protein [Acidimicrobiales bacterium]|jgi:excisionase family DNA binding protein
MDAKNSASMAPRENNPRKRRPPLRIPAAAEYLGTTDRHVRRLIAERRITSYRLGGRVLLSPDDLDELLARSRREAIR